MRFVSALDLVIGDVVLMQEGDCVPADILLIWTNSVVIDESLLTGKKSLCLS